MSRALAPTVAAATAVVTLLSGCTEASHRCDDRPEPSDVSGHRRPVAIRPGGGIPALTTAAAARAVPAAGPGATGTDRLLVRLQRETLLMADDLRPVRPGRCTGTLPARAGATTRCTVFYADVEVTWKVERTGTQRGTRPRYATTPLTGVHTARAVYAAYARHVARSDADGPLAPRDPRCDRLPDVFTAPPGEDTGYFCQDILWSCRSGDFDFTWNDLPVRTDDHGKVTFE
ncbi:hypothetical protein DMB38_16550 [Streptomyces sp. WAC 06738]|uniref:hypothetical protein n=1 Tax=Streptomyces sp. WAC 06738 TaxID=2203210 RepID=UPI000F6F907E|nr:hypothetical protein [Streptomyces sp. WAC 06738]AZM47192.1 hypothetical protein DMB38_16550 [Streptomyces sp. WAC 06738]